MARLQARLNVARLAATRLGDYYPSVFVFINSLQAYRPGGAQGIVIDKSLSINEAEGDVPRTASFTIRDVTSPPQQGQRVYVAMGSADHLIFRGHILKVSQTQPGGYYRSAEFAVDCQDNQRLLNRRMVTTRFTSTDAGVIIKALVSSFTTGFTTVHVGTLGQVDEIEFTDERVTKAITRVINRVGGRWYLDPTDDVHAFVGEEAGVSPAADISATGKHFDWEHQKDTSQVRTKVVCLGAEQNVSQTAIGGSTQVFVDDTAKFTSVSTIAVSGRYGRFVTNVTSVSGTLADGIPLPFVIFASSIGGGGVPSEFGPLVANDRIGVYAVVQSTTYQSSIAAIEGGDGVHEYVVSDGRLTQAGAVQRAQAELTLYGPIEQSGTYVTRDPSTTVGRIVYLNAASQTHVTSVTARIQRVSMSKFEQSTRVWNSARTHLFPQRRVSYSTAAIRDTFQILGDFERGGS